MSANSSTPSPTSGSRLHEEDDDNDLTDHPAWDRLTKANAHRFDPAEDQQHDEHDADHRERVGTRGHLLQLHRQRVQLGIGEGGDTRVDRGRVDAERRELLPHLVPRQGAIDGREIPDARVRLDGLQGADHGRIRDHRRTEVQNCEAQGMDDESLEHGHHRLDTRIRGGV